MKIMILHDDERIGVKAGEIYEAKRYKYDPHEKYDLIGRVPDGHDPECTQYISSVATLICQEWMTVSDSGAYVPLDNATLEALEKVK